MIINQQIPHASIHTPQTSRINRSRLHTNYDNHNYSREEQGYPNETTHTRYINELEQRAFEYENEYRKLENEISDYKLQLQYAV